MYIVYIKRNKKNIYIYGKTKGFFYRYFPKKLFKTLRKLFFDKNYTNEIEWSINIFFVLINCFY